MISIFTTEAIAIWTALKNWVSETENYIILTDSLSVLKSIQNINRKSNTIILNLSSTLHQRLQTAQSITFIWVPAHKGIGINEEVDKLAKASPEPAPLLENSISCRAGGSLVVRASDSRPEGLDPMPDVTKYSSSIHGFHANIVEIGGVAIYRPLGNFPELNRTVTWMVLEANDRRTSSPLPR
ncbi:hypothetical protein TNCV_3869261 [Trichonephila clavipes]|nr:hypothetical protein TNCV_3869261 [Trichonephila clavipes]